jgi:DNA gyrase subunit A
MASSNIRTIGRATQGVRLIDIEGEDRAVSIARLAEKDEERLEDKAESPADENGDAGQDEKGEE